MHHQLHHSHPYFCIFRTQLNQSSHNILLFFSCTCLSKAGMHVSITAHDVPFDWSLVRPTQRLMVRCVSSEALQTRRVAPFGSKPPGSKLLRDNFWFAPTSGSSLGSLLLCVLLDAYNVPAAEGIQGKQWCTSFNVARLILMP